MSAERPLVSVVIEGYNETRSLGLAANTLAALARQDFPLDRVEVLLVGSAAQRPAWESAVADAPFGSVRFVEAPAHARYFELKNLGAKAARADILAMTDSDSLPTPEWLSGVMTAMERGADVTIGSSYFNRRGGWEPDTLWRLAPASISWGWILGKTRGGAVEPAGLIDHNVAFRAEVFRRLPYRTEHGRVLGGPIMLSELRAAGMRVAVAPEQRDVHSFTWRWWIGLLFRYGYEVYRLRRVDPGYPNLWIKRAGPLEPLATLGWHFLLDLPRWFRYCRFARISRVRTLALFPVSLCVSLFARTVEMAGMTATLLAPERMRVWSENF